MESNSNNKDKLKFDNLITFFEETQRELQKQAVRSVDIALVVRNWLFGWYIVEFENGLGQRSQLYGKKLIPNLSKELKKRKITGVSVTNLKQCRAFYFTNRHISRTLSDQSSINLDELASLSTSHGLKVIIDKLTSSFKLGWSHYATLLTVNSDQERHFYELESIANSWSVRELRRQIDSSLYERLALSRDSDKVKELSEKGQIVNNYSDIIKDPYILEFLDLPQYPQYSEHEFEKAIIDNIEHFLLELGKGFLFEARQKRFTFADDHFYVDLVFYNRLLRCYVLIDLKIGKLTHQDIGQMQMYVNYFDRFVKLDNEYPTVGIILCHYKNQSVVELTLPKNSNIRAAEYKLYLPSKQELKEQIKIAHHKLDKKKQS
jgi:predicted nuclease of restriction endonuclease-like (RecB) superfamily